MAGISDKLAKFKQPKKILFVDALPRNTMGKVQKAVMRKEHEKMFS
jgi:malonyl-CoA/methylmalonyl-CoA synthetase